MLDIKVCQSITSLIERLATTGKEEISRKTFKELVGFAGQSEEYLKFCLERIFQHLEKKHCEIRYGTFLIVEELFKRSQCFRELLLDDFHIFLELTVESDSSKLLPPPLHVAKKLKARVLQAIHKWYSQFGEEHKRLSLSYNFLKHNLKVDFEDALKRNANELRTERKEQERQAKVVTKKLDAMKADMEENVEDISRIVTEVNNCFCLLVPKPEDLFGPSTESSMVNDDETYVAGKLNYREHGLQGPGGTIAIHVKEPIGRIKKTDDNSAIIDNLRELCLLLKNRYLVLIKKWIYIASKASDQKIFKKVMDLKELVEDEVKRFNQLQLVDESANDTNSSESESDFEEVPEKEGYEAEASCPPAVLPTCEAGERSQPTPSTSQQSTNSRAWKLWDVSFDDAKDPTSLLATLKNRSEKLPVATKTDLLNKAVTTSATGKYKEVSQNTEEESRKQKLLKVAPKRPYDVDLYHWEDKDLKAPSFEIVETDGHKFWTPSMDRAGETIEDPNGIASLRTRVIEFSGTFEPVKWSCRTPLSNGSLCPRKDRIKCPFHGKIVARNLIGIPQRQEDIVELEKEKEKVERDKPPDWQDPEFLKDIQAEIGIDLTVKPAKKGKKKNKTFAEQYPGLTDIEKTKNTPRTRLGKKVFNKSAMKRVAETLDEMSSKKFKDKFGDQWNYAMH